MARTSFSSIFLVISLTGDESYTVWSKSVSDILYYKKSVLVTTPAPFWKVHIFPTQKIKKIKRISLNKESGWSTFSWSSIMLLHTLSPHWEQLKKKMLPLRKKTPCRLFCHPLVSHSAHKMSVDWNTFCIQQQSHVFHNYSHQSNCGASVLKKSYQHN